MKNETAENEEKFSEDLSEICKCRYKLLKRGQNVSLNALYICMGGGVIDVDSSFSL